MQNTNTPMEKYFADMRKNGEILFLPSRNGPGPHGKKFIYLEATAGAETWRLFDRLPLEMTFFPAPSDKYRKDKKK